MKNKIKIESFAGFLPSFVYQDFFAQMFIYNILQYALHLVNSKLKEILYKKQVMHNKNYKNNKNINKNNSIGLLKEKLIKIMMTVNDTIRGNEYIKLIAEMLKYISEVVLKNLQT
ncbi:transposase [Clostridium sp. DL-VIII]|uniref:hypothetical protein n=1 Tax=Clostridium sp. DL-VIII TaxID=641107 RepID=UPI00023B049D|nr:hypothetical protein [Clostridium sp. DL-VIII]EHJ01916.1 transposase [Clostridium sp. DL-VIII]